MKATGRDLYAPLLLAALVLAAYAPAFNNGFISDDYVMFGRLEDLRRDPLYLFSIPPETFRATCYGAFALLRALFGYHSPFFYGFSMALHLANAMMIWRILSGFDTTRHAALAAAALFAVYQNPQEGIMWLAGMNESLMTTCVLGALWAWFHRRFAWFVVLFAAALFSKESALVLLVLIPLADSFRTGELRFRREYLLMTLPVLPFATVYLMTRNANALLSHGLYEVHWRAAWVLLHSAHRMLFPWGYLALMGGAVAGARAAIQRAAAPAFWMAVCLLPYVFLTYQSHVPSRNQYLASTGFVWLAATLACGLPRRARTAYMATFLCINVGYLWTVKDGQYVARGAPTARLAAALRTMVPQPVLVLNFPENPWIGANIGLTLPGWTPSLLRVNQPEDSCPNCPCLVWDPGSRSYGTR